MNGRAVLPGKHFRCAVTVLLGLTGGAWAQDQVANEGQQSDAATARHFESRVAPIFSQHCLECHDATTKQGGLDLSRKAATLAGGENGPALAPGNLAKSLLWQRVESGEMPADRPPLSAEEKESLRKWIEDGATWSFDFVDPAVYAQGSGGNKTFVQRLTVPEYIETVQSTLGVDIAKESRELLPRDLRADGFSNTAYNLNVDLGHIEAYARLAEIIVGRLDIKAFANKHTTSRELTDENVTKVVEPLGKLLLRGPVSDQEKRLYCGISTTVGGAGGNFDEALRFITEAMLQSPRFIYRIEQQPKSGVAAPVGEYELASRLSYILWGGPPDEELLKLADNKSLSKQIESQAQRMLRDARAIARSREFISEWLDLDGLDDLRPSTKRFPHWNASLAADMRNETLAFFEEVVWKQNRPLSDLLNAKVTFVTARLAKHYGLPPLDANVNDGELMRYDLSSVPERGGLLTQGSVLTVGGDDASTVTRGLFVMHELLRGVVKDPPPGIDTTQPPTKAGLTQRAVAESRLANKSCTGCHGKFEPLSFGLGKFDGLGSYREKDEHGNALADDDHLLFPGAAEAVKYNSAGEMMDLLARSERVRETLMWKVAQFALGRPLGAADVRSVAEIHHAAQQEGGTYTGLMTAIVTSELVRTTRTGE